MLRELGEDGFFRAVLVHHPPINGSARVPKQLRDGAGFRKVIADAGAELVLHGHNHRFDQGETKTPLGSAPVIGVPSASARPKNGSRAAAYHIYRINPANNGWHIQMDIRRFDRHSECFVADRRHHFSVPAALVTASAA
jgi:3',5'-cyclic AMP phosphodiesterase CpdA